MSAPFRPDSQLPDILRRVNAAAALLPCGAEHSCPAQLRRQALILDQNSRHGAVDDDLTLRAKELLAQIDDYLRAPDQLW